MKQLKLNLKGIPKLKPINTNQHVWCSKYHMEISCWMPCSECDYRDETIVNEKVKNYNIACNHPLLKKN